MQDESVRLASIKAKIKKVEDNLSLYSRRSISHVFVYLLFVCFPMSSPHIFVYFVVKSGGAEEEWKKTITSYDDDHGVPRDHSKTVSASLGHYEYLAPISDLDC